MIEATLFMAAFMAGYTVRDYSTTVLQPEQHAAFWAALDASESPALTDLMRLHAEVTAGE